MAEKQEKILEVKDLRISFRTNSGTVKAVRGISFDLYKGRTLAIVGESGSGKSVTSRAILGILANNKIVEGGQILYDGKDLLALKEEQFTHIRGSKISMIFQDPLSSLNPIMRVGKQLTEPMFLKAKAQRRESRKNLISLKKSEAKERKILNITNDLRITQLQKNEYKKYIHEKYIRNDIKYDLLNSDIFNKFENDELLNKFNTFKTFINDYLALNKDEILKENVEINIQHLKENYKLGLEIEKLIKLNKDKLKEQEFNDLVENFHKLNKKFYLNELHKNLIHLDYNEDLKLEDYREYLSTILKSNYDYSFKKLKELKEYLIKFNEENFQNMETFDTKKVLKTLKEIKHLIKKAQFDFATEKDDIIEVYPVSIRNYIEQYIESKKLVLIRQKLLNSYLNEDGTMSQIPNDVKAGERETIVKPEEFFKIMGQYTTEIISYIDDRIENEKFDSQTYIDKFFKYFCDEYNRSKTRVLKSEAKKRAIKLLKAVGIPDPKRRYKQYPFEFSGGMRQRIVIAIALSSNPEILICDEPTTALDVTIQAQILELINKLKDEMNLSIIFITHDLGVVANMADDIAVMYAGKIVEYGTVYDIFYDPRHPYTWALLGSMPDLNTKEKLDAIPGTPPNMLLPPRGDAFAARNKYAMKIDFEMQPPFFKISDTHFAATWLLHEDAPDVQAPKVVRDRIERSLKENPENIPVYTLAKNSILGGLKDVRR